MLKCWPQFFKAMKDGTKTFEIRKNDRDFKVGEKLRVCEYFPTTLRYSGEELLFEITYVTEFMQISGNVVMGIRRIDPK